MTKKTSEPPQRLYLSMDAVFPKGKHSFVLSTDAMLMEGDEVAVYELTKIGVAKEKEKAKGKRS